MCFVLDYLLKHHCRNSSSSEAVSTAVLNALDPFFDNKNGPLFLSAARLFYATAEGLLGENGLFELYRALLKGGPLGW